MLIRLHIKKNHLNNEKETTIHSLPCKIKGDGLANVSSYFTPYLDKEKTNELEVSFRGYPLNGQILKIPKNYKGIVFHETMKPEDPKTRRHFNSQGSFSQFTYWNYDRFTSKNDSFIAALDWIDVAEALHSTLDHNDD